MVITILVITFLCALQFDFLPLLKERKTKACILYGILFSISFVILILTECGVVIPSPLDFFKTWLGQAAQ